MDNKKSKKESLFREGKNGGNAKKLRITERKCIRKSKKKDCNMKKTVSIDCLVL